MFKKLLLASLLVVPAVTTAAPRQAEAECGVYDGYSHECFTYVRCTETFEYCSAWECYPACAEWEEVEYCY